jgi:UDPglucose 6-dehydrogenase
VKALVRTGQDARCPLSVVEAVDEANNRQKAMLVPRVEKYLGGLSGKTIALWGLAFKPRTDDMREAPALVVVESLLAGGASVRVYDPKATTAARRILGDRVEYCSRSYEAIEGADALIVVTEWGEFREPDFERMKTLMRRPAIFDGRNIYKPEHLRELGFHYEGIGRR